MKRFLGACRAVLGLAQVMGATVALVLLVQTGTSALTVTATLATLFLVVLSRLLFARLDRKD